MSANKRGKAHNAAQREQIKIDSLPPRSVVIDRNGDAWQTSGLYWYRAFGDSSLVSSYDIRQLAPFSVVHTPGR